MALLAGPGGGLAGPGGGGVVGRVVAPDVGDEFGDGGRAVGPAGEGVEERAPAAGAAHGTRRGRPCVATRRG
ncbi:hypothetical protein ACWGAN_11270 [Streptomyces sp. NPDC054945]